MTGERDFLVGKRVTVIGLGIEGIDVARYAATHGAARVSALDTRTPDALAGALEQLRGLDIQYTLGQHRPDDLAGSDVVFASQSIFMDNPWLVYAREHGMEVTSMTRAFMEHCPGPTIGVTGSSGKTTTTALVAHMLGAAGLPHIAGGNIGVGLLGQLDGMQSSTWAVMEISHTQLQLTDRSPHIAAILNVTPNHLDQFTWDRYVSLKMNMVRHQSPDDDVVLNLDDDISAAMADATPARAVHFTLGAALPGDGAFLRDDALFLRRENVDEMLLPASEVPLPGRHNVANALAASAVASLAGVPAETIASAVRSFHAVAHRLELVAEIDGVRYVNDSIATTPERALAGIRSFDAPIVLLLGGKDKDLPKDELAAEALRRCSGIVFFGADGALFEAAVEAHAAEAPFEEHPITVRAATLDEAVREARAMAEAGDVVLCSPACTSFDAYPNFEARGEHFRRLVRALAEAS